MHNGILKTAKITIVYDENELQYPKLMNEIILDEFLETLSNSGIVVHFDYSIENASEEEKEDYIKYTTD